MKEKKRFIWQIGLILLVFCSGLIFWNVFIIISPSDPLPVRVAYLTHSEPHNFSYPVHLLSENDYSLLANYSFAFSILNLRCSKSTFLLALVHSAPKNFHKRMVIRSTWGNKTENVEVFYVMGSSSNVDTQRKIDAESRKYSDVIQGNFLDVYRNLTLKHIMSLKYVTYHCPQAKYILKTDDDVFVNMPLMKNFLSNDLSPFGASQLLLCSVQKSASVLRTYRSKWRVAFEEYPFRKYPPYCPGWAILYSPDVVFRLYKSAQNTSEIFWIDDVHITGILAAKNNIVQTDNTDMIISESAQHQLVNNDVFPKEKFLFGQPDLKEREIRTMWAEVVAHTVTKSAFK
uniref:Hexosyltransferase n=2 Tax=Dendroctonus ponderosae TaxID=77166 RepID=A0AAR5P0K8_DENPD